MKKSLIAWSLAIILSMVVCTAALAAAPGGGMSTNGVLTLTGSLTKQSGTTYKMLGKNSANQIENLSVSVYVYKVDGSTYTYVDSTSASKSGTSVTAEKLVTLGTGKYELRVYGSGNTIPNASVFYIYNY